jgi:vacuolar iron transporter family protein
MKKDHFEGKNVAQHLKEARQKGALASAEIHGTEMPGHFAAFADTVRDVTLIFSAVFLLIGPQFWILFILVTFLTIWKTGRSALLGYARLERLHRVIEEERWEIEHSRAQEEEELHALYAAKGFSGQMLESIISTLSSDDNRLLRIMLEEEMGLTLEAYEHPLKQAAGALLGGIVSSLVVLTLPFGAAITLSGAAILLIFAASLMAHLERNRMIEAVIWNLALGGFTLGLVYFIKGLLL